MIPQQVDQRDMIAMEKLIDELATTYTPEGAKYLAHKRLSAFHKYEWLDEQNVEGTLQSGFSSKFPEMALMNTKTQTFTETSESDDRVVKLLLHCDSIDFNQLKELTEYCIIHQLTCTIKPASWESAFLIEIQKRQESITEIKTAVERKSLAEA